GPGDGRQRGHEAGGAVACDDLGGDDIDLEPELAADVLLDAWVDGRVRADRTADATDASVLGGGLEAGDGPIELSHPARDLEAEGDGLGDDAVRASRHQRPPVLDRQLGGGLPD